MVLSGKILSNAELKTEIPITDNAKNVIENSKNELKEILSGYSNKVILIIGPCSADFENSLMEYGEFVSHLRKTFGDKIEIIMRYYTGKPRTVGGWKGLSNSKPGESPDISRGIIRSRELAISLIDTYNIPLADEMLHPQLVNKFNDVFSYLAIGARSTENQYHREVSSGLDIPIGFKNTTAGDIESMVNSIKAGQTTSSYTISDKIYDTKGNEFAHGILRGGRVGINIGNELLRDNIISIIGELTKSGKLDENLDSADLYENIFNELKLSKSKNLSNFSISDLEYLSTLLATGVKNPAFLVDTNHENSNKTPENQIKIVKEVFKNIDTLKEKGINVGEYFKGFMVESYLYDGRQDFPKDGDESKIKAGLSLTDPCIGKEKTLELIQEIYNNL